MGTELDYKTRQTSKPLAIPQMPVAEQLRLSHEYFSALVSKQGVVQK
jgi:hypothetical protein